MSQLSWVLQARSGSAAVIQTIATRFLILGVNLANGIICARNLGPSGRGEQAAMLLWPQLLCFVLTLGVPFAVVFESRRHNEDLDSLCSAAVILSIVLGCVATVVGVLFIPHWLHQYDSHAIMLAQWLMIFGPQIMLSLTIGSIFESQFNFSASNLLRYGPPLLTFVGLYALAFSHHFTPFTSALAYAIPTFVLSVIVIPKVLRLFVFTINGFASSTRRLLSYGLRMYGSDILSTFGTQIDQLLVVGLLTPSNLGTYTVALSTSRVLNIFQTSVRVVLLPKTAGLETHEVVSVVGRVARISTALTALSAVGLLLLMPLLLPKLYGHDFIGAIIVAQVLTMESVLASTTGVLAQSFTATNRPGVATLLQGLGLAVALPCMLILIPRFGLVGAALALLCSTAARLAIALACYPILLSARVPALILKRDDIAFVRARLNKRTVKASG